VELEISNMKKGKDVKELYRKECGLEDKRLRLLFTGHEIQDEFPLYKFKLTNGVVIVVFII